MKFNTCGPAAVRVRQAATTLGHSTLMVSIWRTFRRNIVSGGNILPALPEATYGSFEDLPDATRDALWENHKRKLAFPAGLEEHESDCPF